MSEPKPIAVDGAGAKTENSNVENTENTDRYVVTPSHYQWETWHLASSHIGYVRIISIIITKKVKFNLNSL